MPPIHFVGVRGGHGTTTVALAAAVILAGHQPVRISTTDPRALCSAAGVSHDDPPIELAPGVTLAVDGETVVDMTDGLTLDQLEGETDGLTIAVLRGPDYLGVRTLCEHANVAIDGLVVVSEAGRALDARDVEHVTGRPVLAVVDATPAVARLLDAGLYVHRVTDLGELRQLRTWIHQLVSTEQDAPCPAAPAPRRHSPWSSASPS